MSTIGIKINDNCFSANTAKTIRDIINISISELKEKICNNEFILIPIVLIKFSFQKLCKLLP